jgi:LysW-gamma-L-lysine carboxypeptidase
VRRAWPDRAPAPVDQTIALGLLRGMLDIPSVSCHEAELAQYLAATLRHLGFQTRVDAVGNVIAEIVRGPGPSTLLIGHLDTVDGHGVKVGSAEGRLYGRGAVDAKGPMAAMVCAALQATQARGRITVVGAVEEETPGSRGAMEIRRAHPRPDHVIVGEPSGWDAVVLGYKGKLDLHYRVERPATHPSNPIKKASETMAEAWSALLATLGPEAGHLSFDQPGATLCTIRGDTTWAEGEFSIRTPLGFDSARFLTSWQERLDGGVLTVVNEVAACRVTRRDPVVQALFHGIRGEGATPVAKVKMATSDMNTLAEVWDVPIATYGPGDSRLDHADDEHIVIDDYFRGIAVLSRALDQLSTDGRSSSEPRIRVVR